MERFASYALAIYHLFDAGPGERFDYRLNFLHAFTPATLRTTH